VQHFEWQLPALTPNLKIVLSSPFTVLQLPLARLVSEAWWLWWPLTFELWGEKIFQDLTGNSTAVKRCLLLEICLSSRSRKNERAGKRTHSNVQSGLRQPRFHMYRIKSALTTVETFCHRFDAQSSSMALNGFLRSTVTIFVVVEIRQRLNY